ncbi:hypothetical protein HEP89_04235 [Labrenzia sp. 5N]|uniref:hypothetical protein n=1 Tax=Labrenzia sp. 5N TaxID=2723402 RepID=UPI001447D184|nr:hypothetical protein [Labrenzia sp. 5N]NKX63297.1 hypothetical protein [Labrenzia sp. 5N]
MTTHMKPPGAEAPHSSQIELNWTQALIALGLPLPISEEVMQTRYPIGFIVPPVDHDFIKGAAPYDDAGRQVEDKAEADFTSLNPVDVEGLESRKTSLISEIKINDRAAEQARQEGEQEPRYEEVAVKEAKYLHTKIFTLHQILHAILIAFGVIVMGATLSNVILGSDKVPLAYDYPAIVYLFAFVPVTIMVVIAQAWQWIKCERCKASYKGALFLLCLLVSAAWIATFGPAYSDATDLSDLSVDPGFDFYPLHITLQLCGEILLGALLKIALFRMDRDSRKTEPRETAASKMSRASVNMLALINAPLLIEQAAIARQLKAYAAAKRSFVATCLAALRAEQAAMALLEERANAAALQARVATKEAQSPANPLH